MIYRKSFTAKETHIYLCPPIQSNVWKFGNKPNCFFTLQRIDSLEKKNLDFGVKIVTFKTDVSSLSKLEIMYEY